MSCRTGVRAARWWTLVVVQVPRWRSARAVPATRAPEDRRGARLRARLTRGRSPTEQSTSVARQDKARREPAAVTPRSSRAVGSGTRCVPPRRAAPPSIAVSTQGPSAVTATVCSQCAAWRPSAVTTVQRRPAPPPHRCRASPSARPPGRSPGSSRMPWPGPFGARFGTNGGSVHGGADAVAGVVLEQAVAVRADDLLDGVADVGEPAVGTCGGEPRPQRLLRDGRQREQVGTAPPPPAPSPRRRRASRPRGSRRSRCSAARPRAAPGRPGCRATTSAPADAQIEPGSRGSRGTSGPLRRRGWTPPRPASSSAVVTRRARRAAWTVRAPGRRRRPASRMSWTCAQGS